MPGSKGTASSNKGFDNTTVIDNATFASEKMSAISALYSNLSISGSWNYLVDSLERMKRSSENGRSNSRKEHTCVESPNKNLCLPKSYSKFELPFTDSVNAVEIGIDIIDVLRINDKVSKFSTYICMICTYYNKPNCLVRLGEVRFNKSAQSSLSTHLNKLKCSKHSTSGSDSPEHIDKKITHAWIQKEQPVVIRVSTIPQ